MLMYHGQNLEKWGSARGSNPPQFIEGIHGPPRYGIIMV